MKIQCSCGAKYSFEVTPEMARRPIHFICQACGLDVSESVNQLIRLEFGPDSGASSMAAPLRIAHPSSSLKVATPVPMAPSATPFQASAVTPPDSADTPETDALPKCAKHAEPAQERCRVCSKPICPRCMELFGYLCSPLCKAKAASHGINVPVYGAQKSVVEARVWRRVGLATAVIGILGGLALGLWFWYAWFGSTPKTYFAVRLEQPAFSGHSVLCGHDQIVFLHGGTLARHDMKEKKQIWSRYLIDKKQIDLQVAGEMKRKQAAVDKANSEGRDNVPKMPDPEKLAAELERYAAAGFDLRVFGSNIWVITPEKISRFDWDTGNPVKEITLDQRFGGAISRSNELVFSSEQGDDRVLMHLDLATSHTRAEPLGSPKHSVAGAGQRNKSGSLAAGSSSRNQQSSAGLPLGTPGKDAGKAMDPAKVAEQAQHLPLPAKMALPALIGNSLSQERTLEELNDEPGSKPHAQPPIIQPGDELSFVPTKDGFVQFSVRLLESRMVQHSAMKAAPGRSALDGNLSASKSQEAANEMLNEMQRSRGGDVVVEDESRYQATLSSPDGKDSWSGEVVGRPSLHPLGTVNALIANKTLIIFDKSHKKLWESTLTYNVPTGSSGSGTDGETGQGPIVERKGSLYVFDQGVLTAFALSTGNVRWRLPSVGISGIFFDDHDMLYVNTTTASPDSIKYSRQIDLTQKTGSVVVKLDSKTGAQLWTAQLGGWINYVSGPYVYSVQSFQPQEKENDTYMPDTGFEASAYLRVKRINPKNGKVMWEHFQQRCPVDVRFDQNKIQLVFRKEVQVLKFLAF